MAANKEQTKKKSSKESQKQQQQKRQEEQQSQGEDDGLEHTVTLTVTLKATVGHVEAKHEDNASEPAQSESEGSKKKSDANGQRRKEATTMSSTLCCQLMPLEGSQPIKTESKRIDECHDELVSSGADELRVKEDVVRSLVRNNGAMQLALVCDAEQKGGGKQVVHAFDATGLLLGRKEVVHSLPFNGGEETEEVTAMFRSISVLVHSDKEFIPPAVKQRVNPIDISVKEISSLPDAPATKDKLDSQCEPVRLNMDFSGRQLAFEVPEMGVWRELHDGMSVRDAHVDQHSLLAEDELEMSLMKFAKHGRIRIKVEDRTPKGQSTAEVFGQARPSLQEIAREGRKRADVDAYLFPGSIVRGGGELGWSTRPGRYVEAGSSVVFSVESCKFPDREVSICAPEGEPAAASPPKKDVDEEPFSRCVVITEYDDELFKQIEREALQVNAQALGITGPHDSMMRSLATYELTEEQAKDPTLDVITGLHMTDGTHRLVLLEGLREGGLSQLVRKLGHEVLSTKKVSVLGNLSIGFPDRVYWRLGVEFQTMKLNQPLERVAKSPGALLGHSVRQEVKSAIAKIWALMKVRTLSEAVQLDLIPSGEEMLFLEKRFTGVISTEDKEGPKREKPRRKSKSRRSESARSRRSSGRSRIRKSRQSSLRRSYSNESEGSFDGAGGAELSSASYNEESSTGNRLHSSPSSNQLDMRWQSPAGFRSYGLDPTAENQNEGGESEEESEDTVEEGVDNWNEDYLIERRHREERRKARHFLSEERTRLRDLERERAHIKQEWARWNPRRVPLDQLEEETASVSLPEHGTKHRQEREGEDEEEEEEDVGERRQPFMYPTARSPEEWRSLGMKKPSEARIEELRQPYDTVISTSTASVARGEDAGDVEGRREFRAFAGNASGLIERNTGSVHCGDREVEEEEERKRKEREEWRRKVVVSNLHVRTGPPSKGRTDALDKTRTLLVGKPEKRSIRTKGQELPLPSTSLRLGEQPPTKQLSPLRSITPDNVQEGGFNRLVMPNGSAVYRPYAK